MYYCIDYNMSSCEKRICCKECNDLICRERCNLTETVCHARTKSRPMTTIEYLKEKCGDVKRALDL